VQEQCHEIYASTPLYLIRTFFSGRAGLTADDDESASVRKISGYLDEIGRNTQDNRDLVASLLGVALNSGEEAATTPQLLKQKQYEFIVSLFGQAARARPLILWIEDVHWLDPSSAELLRDIGADYATLPQGSSASGN
jgi:predicted ATPase